MEDFHACYCRSGKPDYSEVCIYHGNRVSTPNDFFSSHTFWFVGTRFALNSLCIDFHRNLDAYNGSSNLDNHFAQFRASRYIQTDGILVPNGTIANTSGTPLDFSTAKSLGAAINETVGLDFCGTGSYNMQSQHPDLSSLRLHLVRQLLVI